MKHVVVDLGNVIALFDHRRASRQLASLSTVPVTEDEVFRAIFDSSLEPDLDCGRISPQDFLDRLRTLLHIAAPDDAIMRAWCDIFRPNESVVALLPRLKGSAARLLLASNTNPLHFEWLLRQMPEPLALFDECVLSYQVGVRKPAPDFFRRCAAAAGGVPGDCVFVDDRHEFVEEARALGMAGVTYYQGLDLAEALRAKGVVLA